MLKNKLKLCIVVGTRPELVKMSPIVAACKDQSIDYFILHTGQHYSYEMNEIFFAQLKLPVPKYNLEVGSGTDAEETGEAMIGIEKVLKEEKPTVVLVEGDTNTVLAGALAAVKIGIKIGHVEAGLRSYDRSMPEEINRILADHCAHYLFAPTERAKKTLLKEGLGDEQIFVTGNTIVDVIKQNMARATENAEVLSKLKLEPKHYLLATVHRKENVDMPERFTGILEGLHELSKELGLPVIYPIHPRSKKRIQEMGLDTHELRLIDPQDFFSFLQLEYNAKLVLTDSGGVQEESCILGVPCVTLRYNTERPETLEVGSNILAGTEPKEVVRCAKTMLTKGGGWANPFGDGDAGARIVGIVREANA